MRILVGLCVLVILGAATGRGQGERMLAKPSQNSQGFS